MLPWILSHLVRPKTRVHIWDRESEQFWLLNKKNEKQKATIGEQQNTRNKNQAGRKEKREIRTEQRKAICEQKTADLEQGSASNKKQGVRGD